MPYTPTATRFYTRTVAGLEFSPTTWRRLKQLIGTDSDDPMVPCSPQGPVVRVTGWFPKVENYRLAEMRSHEGRLTIGPYGLGIHSTEYPERVVLIQAFQARLIEVIEEEP